FIIRGTPYNKGKILKLLLDHGAEPVGDPKQCHAVASDGRAPKFDEGIVTRLDCLPLGIVVNRYAERFYDEGEDLWPKRYAIWGRLVAQQPDQIAYSIFDSKVIGRFMPSVFPPIAASSITELAAALGLPPEKLESSVREFNQAVRPGRFDHQILDDCRSEGLNPPKSHWAQTIDRRPYYGFPPRPRMTFSDADMDYLANLCHNCAECYYACQYAPPHEFGVNVPKVLAEIRARSYEKNAWPRFWPVSATWAVMAGIIVTAALAGRRATTGADFYGVVSHDVMVGAFAAVFAVIILVHAAGFLRFWRDSGEKLSEAFTPAVLLNALRDGLSLKNLDSHGAGCTYPDEHHSQARRWFHHLTFYGFLLCTASTSVAAFYHSVMGWSAPYPYFSLPVVLGT